MNAVDVPVVFTPLAHANHAMCALKMCLPLKHVQRHNLDPPRECEKQRNRKYNGTPFDEASPLL